VLVAAAEGVADLEVGDAARETAGLFKERAEDGAGYFVFALHLFDHQLGVGDDAEALGAVLDGPLQDTQQTGVLGEVVGLDAEEFTQFGDEAAFGVFDDGAVAGGAGVAAGAAVAVGCILFTPRFSGGGGKIFKQVSIHRFPV